MSTLAECQKPETDSLPRKTGGLWRNLNVKVGRGYRTVFFLSLCLLFTVEVVVFLKGQNDAVHRMLLEDFAVLLIADDSLSTEQLRQLEAKLAAIPGVVSANLVQKAESLEILRAQDPELAKSVLLFGNNPMPQFYRLSLSEAVLGDIAGWLDSGPMKLTGITGVSYRPEQVYAILQTSFYGRFINLALSIAAIVFALFVFFCEVSAVKRMAGLYPLGNNWNWLISGAGGAAAAVFLCWFLVYPVKHLSPLWWSFPNAGWHLAVVAAGGLLGWALFRWQESL